MAHPLYHARSSAARHGGPAAAYMDLHSWMDRSKMALADCRHRLALHNAWGIELGLARFGPALAVPGVGGVPVRALLEGHVSEDLGRIPALGDCLPGPGDHPGAGTAPLDQAEHRRRSARRFGGRPGDYRALHALLDGPARHLDAGRLAGGHGLLPTHTALGPFLAEDLLGVAFRRVSDGGEVPTRAAAERHIADDLGCGIPDLADLVGRMPRTTWLCGRALALSARFGDDTTG